MAGELIKLSQTPVTAVASWITPSAETRQESPEGGRDVPVVPAFPGVMADGKH